MQSPFWSNSEGGGPGQVMEAFGSAHLQQCHTLRVPSRDSHGLWRLTLTIHYLRVRPRPQQRPHHTRMPMIDCVMQGREADVSTL
jgi:hypothetical protein